MTSDQKNGFLYALGVFACVAAYFLHIQGAFETMYPMGAVILLIAFAGVAFFLYKYIRSNADKFE